MPPRKQKPERIGKPVPPANPLRPDFRKIPLESVFPDPKNPRRDLASGDPEYHNIQNSIDEFGFVDPIIIDTATREVIGGHQRLTVLRDTGVTELYEIPLGGITWLTPDIDIKQLTKPQRTALNIALNKITGDWDTGRLVEALESIKLDGLDIAITGFGEKELVTFMAEIQKGKDPQDSEPQISRAEELRKEWGTELGQMWQCGQHRIICGDCTDPEAVKRLMQGESANMLFTDPPYGIGVDIANDNLSLKNLEEWNARWLKNLPTAKNISFICYHSPRTFPALLIPAMKENWFFERMLWLTRPDKFPVNSWNGWVLISQAILLFSKGKPEYLKISPAEQDVYKHTAAELGQHSGHPTEKILGHCQSVMRHFAASVILDPFLGSGTTMIACENLGRKCRGCEIDPGYVAVCLQRYKDVTGKDPVLVTE